MRVWLGMMVLIPQMVGCGGDEKADSTNSGGEGGDDTWSAGGDGGDDTSSLAVTDRDNDGFSTEDGDCNDYDPDVYPGAGDTYGDGADQNCDGTDGVDADGDGWASQASGGDDCDDSDHTVNPSVEEECGDGIDNDCSGVAEDVYGVFAVLNEDDLGELEGCEVIDGHLWIGFQGSLEDDEYEWVGSTLTNVDVLSSLTEVTGQVFLASNDSLTHVDGFSSLEAVGELILQENASLTNINGLSSLSEVAASVVITGNTLLHSLDGLQSLNSVGEDLRFIGNGDATFSTSGLESLVSVGGDLSFGWVWGLTDIDGFESLSSVGGDVAFTSNSNLADIDGFTSLSSVGGDVDFTGNTSLCQSFVDAFIAALGTGLVGTDTSERNKGSC